MRTMILLLAALALSGCAAMQPEYTLVPPGEVSVAQGTLTVFPQEPWNRLPKSSHGIADEEAWTQNGPVLDVVRFIGAVPEGQAIVKQKADDDRKVPVFHASMTPQDLTSMIESAYRIRADVKVFETTGVKPAIFLGEHGVQFDYSYMRDDSVRRLGRSMIAVSGGRLYVMSLDGTALHYFNADLHAFEALAASAKAR
jgi:hypothetical protein